MRTRFNNMRVLLLLLLILPIFVQADGIQSCARIVSAVERLDCYDQLAKKAAGTVGHAKEIAPVEAVPVEAVLVEAVSVETVSVETAPVETVPVERVPVDSISVLSAPPATVTRQPMQEEIREAAVSQPGETVINVEENSSRWKLFGLKPKRDRSRETTHLNAFLDKVEYVSSGKKVFTLSNGQVWIERETSPRKIAADQTVTITKKRWHFELDPERGPKVSVERLDPDKNIVRASRNKL